MRDKYKYLALVSGRKQRKDWMEDLATVQTKKLHRIVNAFALNTARASALAVALAEVAYTIRRDQWCLDSARHTVEGKLTSPFVDSPVPPAVAKEYARLLTNWILAPAEQHSSLIGHFGVRSVNVMVTHTTGMDVSMEALLSSVIIESWIAFETLVADLWVTAVDSGPAILRKRVLLKTIKAGNDNNPVDFASTDDIEYDPARKLESALRQARKVSFQKLSLITRNYETAFTSRVKTIFGHDNGYIAALAAYRNALIHNGGRADRTFLNQVKPFPEFKSIKKNRKLALNGELVSKLRHTSATVGAKLIHFVDDILTPP